MDLREVKAEWDRLGPIAHLATVSPGGEPHVVPVHADWPDDELYVMVGVNDRKVANIRADARVCLHSQVTQETDWDHLMVWGTARLLTSIEDKRRLWDGVFSYDLQTFSTGGPENSPNTIFLGINPVRALVLRSFGMQGRA